MAEYQKNYVVTISYDRESLAKGAEQVKLALRTCDCEPGTCQTGKNGSCRKPRHG